MTAQHSFPYRSVTSFPRFLHTNTPPFLLQVLLVVVLGTAWSPESGGPGAGVEAAAVGRVGTGRSYSSVYNNGPSKSYSYATHHPASGSYVANVNYGPRTHYVAPSSAAAKPKTPPATPAVQQAAASTSGRGEAKMKKDGVCRVQNPNLIISSFSNREKVQEQLQQRCPEGVYEPGDNLIYAVTSCACQIKAGLKAFTQGLRHQITDIELSL